MHAIIISVAHFVGDLPRVPCGKPGICPVASTLRRDGYDLGNGGKGIPTPVIFHGTFVFFVFPHIGKERARMDALVIEPYRRLDGLLLLDAANALA